MPQQLIPDSATQRQIDSRQAELEKRTRVLPGSIPHQNIRPINVPGRFDGCTLLDVMSRLHPRISLDEWQHIFAVGRISKDQRPVAGDRRVRGGEQFSHLFPDTVEPDVNAAIEILWQDEALIIVNKPAPLPMHPSGRFNHNTLISLLQSVYEEKLFVRHRLDANTTGVVLFARGKSAARSIQEQFESKMVRKEYLARCHGHLDSDAFECDDPIGRSRGKAALRPIDAGGKTALTRFRVLARHPDGTSTLIVQPVTGRTNQIRIHLWGRGHSIVGDPLYLPERSYGESQTQTIGALPMCLHAHQLSFIHPQTQQFVQATAKRPAWCKRREASQNTSFSSPSRNATELL